MNCDLWIIVTGDFCALKVAFVQALLPSTSIELIRSCINELAGRPSQKYAVHQYNVCVCVYAQ